MIAGTVELQSWSLNGCLQFIFQLKYLTFTFVFLVFQPHFIFTFINNKKYMWTAAYIAPFYIMFHPLNHTALLSMLKHILTFTHTQDSVC